MKKLLALIISLSAISGITGKDNPVTVDIWNKTDQPLYFKISNIPNPIGENLIELGKYGEEETETTRRLIRAAKYVGAQTGLKAVGIKVVGFQIIGDYAQSNEWDTSTPTYILLTRKQQLTQGDQVTLLTIKPGKDIFIRIKPDSKGVQIFPESKAKYLVGPQTGPLLGWLGRTERWLPLKKNVKQDDIKINTKYVIGAKKPIVEDGDEPEDEEEESEIEAESIDVSDTPTALDNILENFDQEGNYIGAEDFTQDDADAYEDVLESGKAAGMAPDTIAYYEGWLETVKGAVGQKGLSESNKQLVNTLSDVLKDNKIDQDEQQEVAEAFDQAEQVGKDTQFDQLKAVLDQILTGFDEDGNFIGYEGQEKFVKRHLEDYDTNLLLLKLGEADEDDIEFYDDWRPYLAEALEASGGEGAQ